MIGWVNSSPMAGLDIAQFPHVKAWLERVTARPAVQKGIAVPSPPRGSVAVMARRLAGGEEGLKEKEDRIKAMVEAAKKQYNYVYASP
jgi:glutathione S-transferase